MKKYKIRISRDYVGYYNISANSQEKAIEKASNIMTEEMNDEVEYAENIQVEVINNGWKNNIPRAWWYKNRVYR